MSHHLRLRFRLTSRNSQPHISPWHSRILSSRSEVKSSAAERTIGHSIWSSLLSSKVYVQGCGGFAGLRRIWAIAVDISWFSVSVSMVAGGRERAIAENIRYMVSLVVMALSRTALASVG
jgi:hypothetical protein